MKTILCCALWAGSFGCGLISSDITKTTVDLPAQAYTFDTSTWSNLPSSTPAVPCGSGQVVTDCCNPPAPSPKPDCTATPLVCKADSSGASVCTAEIPETLSTSINLANQVPALKDLSGNVSIAGIRYQVTGNTLNVALPPLLLYLAPSGVTDPNDPSATFFGTVPAIAAGTNPAGPVTQQSTAASTFSAYTKNLSTPFNFIAATTVEIPSGTPTPSGQITISVTVSITAQL